MTGGINISVAFCSGHRTCERSPFRFTFSVDTAYSVVFSDIGNFAFIEEKPVSFISAFRRLTFSGSTEYFTVGFASCAYSMSAHIV